MSKPHLYDWLIEDLISAPTYTPKQMFGCKCVYLNGKLMLVLASSKEPWRGLLIPTERNMHAKLEADFPSLAPHSILKKWLYLPEACDRFEQVAKALIKRIQFNDVRFGVEPRAPKRRASQKTPKNLVVAS